MKTKVYLDFDGTLYNSGKLTANFIKICDKYGISKEEVETFLLDRNNPLPIETIAKNFQNKYHLSNEILTEVENIYLDNNVYEDIIPALDKIKDKYELIILTYGNKEYQEKKIKTSSILKYFTNVIITDSNKSELEKIDYKNGIFIDNNPFEIKSFFDASAKKVIRIRRPSDKYSIIDSLENINEYTNFIELVEKELV